MIDKYELGLLQVDTLFDDFFKQYEITWHSCSSLVVRSSNFKSKTKKIQSYTLDLARERNYMFNLFNFSKNLQNNGSEHAPMAYKVYLSSKRQYRSNLILAKRRACEAYIETAPNKCKAAWDVISQENSKGITHNTSIDPEQLILFFLDSVTTLSDNILVVDTPFFWIAGK